MANEKWVLVTGGSGFLGGHCILLLLQRGYRVKTTVRSSSKQDKVRETLRQNGIRKPEEVVFIEADLDDDRNWNEAVKDCEYVLHVASPLYLEHVDSEEVTVRPAVNGTLRVLKAARDAGVKG